MNEQLLIDSLVKSVGRCPAQADVIGLQQFSLDDVQARAQRFLTLLGDQEDRSTDRGDWLTSDDHTTIRLPRGARAMLYHASGAVKYSSGMSPFQSIFERVEDRERLTGMVGEAARKYNIAQWAGSGGELTFERLWQMKAQGEDKSGKQSEPVLTRVVGAYRHFIGGIPVLGEASVALKLAAGGTLDSLSLQVRSRAMEVIDQARIINSELAAKQVCAQLNRLLGFGKITTPSDLVESQTMRFGYLNLGKRKAQQLLAPAFMAQVVLRHKEERQAYIMVVSATEKPYLPICECGHEGPATAARLDVAATTIRR
jgi:hypothetical protein